MKVRLLKDWASHKKGDIVDITDEAVLKKGIELNLFVKDDFSQNKQDPMIMSSKKNKDANN